MNAPASSALIPVGERDHVLGAEEPELTLIEYGDFGCPFCFAASRPVKSLLERYDTLSLVWRHFPDSGVHATPTFVLGGELVDDHWRRLAQLVPAALEGAFPNSEGG